MAEHVSYEGTWKAIAKSWDFDSTKGEKIVVMFEFIDGPFKGKTIQWFGYFSPKAEMRTMESLRHCGWCSDDIVSLEGMGTREVELVIEDQTYEGKTNSRVKWVNRAARLAIKNPMSAAQKGEFARRMQAKAAEHQQKYGAQPAAPARSDAAHDYASAPDRAYDGPEDDLDQIPF